MFFVERSSCHQTDYIPVDACGGASVLKSFHSFFSKFSALSRENVGEGPTCSDVPALKFVGQLCFHEHKLWRFVAFVASGPPP